MRFTTGLKLCVAGFVAFVPQYAAFAAAPDNLVAYRGVYDLQLENISEKSGITSLTGRMVYEFSGLKCGGYTTQFRFITRVDIKDVPARITDQQTASFESTNGREFHFTSKNYVDQDLAKEVVGEVRHIGNALEVRLTKPEEAEYRLKSAEFPIAHTLQIIKNAMAGKHFFRTRLYDGSEDADELVETTVVIGPQKKPEPDRETKIMRIYGDDPVWPVTVSYFNDADNRDGLPAYRTSFLLYRNGITRDLFMDYGDFSIRGKLVRFDLLDNTAEKTACPK